MRLTNAYLRAAMIARTLVAGLALTVPPILHAQNVAEVQVAPPSVTIKVGERTGLLATAFDRIGNVIPTVRSSGRRTTSRSRGSTTTAPSRVWRAGGRSTKGAEARAKGRARARGSARAPPRRHPPPGGGGGAGRPPGGGGGPGAGPPAGAPHG